MRARYRIHLQAAVAMAAAPYGYTLAIWTSGAVTMHAQGIPSTVEALLFLGGAVAGFAAVGAIAHGSAQEVLRAQTDTRVRLWGGFHLPSVGASLGAVALANHLNHGTVAWPVVAFVATSIYLLVIAGQFVIAEREIG
jgi:hypothetical protein